jgi:ribosomal protein S18 acetylase RimI-like enzyme
MTRPIKSSDLNSIQKLFSSINLFDKDEIVFMMDLVNNIISGNLDETHRFVVNEDGEINAAAYFAPETFGQGVYNLYFIGVLPESQGVGIGSKLLKFVENDVKNLGSRLLLVETSGLPEFEKTRNFYLKNGYEKEATIREYYKAGDDKIVFRKKL